MYGKNLYAISAAITETRDDNWTSSRQVPTFFLDGDVQGITSEDHAERIAKTIVDPFGRFATEICAVKL